MRQESEDARGGQPLDWGFGEHAGGMIKLCPQLLLSPCHPQGGIRGPQGRNP
ncbi:hypothetical protein KSZ_70550 [Dictyobacter formicarum]|uniref:Uncharacterized protein n=1 Tax=Dictyobacter formicarum TaxID=2778368 RepID=A0ABQ3VTU0_9CHLR|nr:hypothetical protein KSZ_70550 [Dictyobacter formicarum]